MSNHTTFNLSTLRSLVGTWQRILRLQDWCIVVVLDESLDLAIGRCCIHRNMGKCVTIKINPDVYRLKLAGCLDPEVTLVHEMLHLFGDAGYFEALAKTQPPALSTIVDTSHENMIETIAQALVSLRRAEPINPMTLHEEVDTTNVRRRQLEMG